MQFFRNGWADFEIYSWTRKWWDSDIHASLRHVPRRSCSWNTFFTGPSFKAKPPRCAGSEFQIQKTLRGPKEESLGNQQNGHGGRGQNDFSAAPKSGSLGDVSSRGNRNDYHKGWEVCVLVQFLRFNDRNEMGIEWQPNSFDGSGRDIKSVLFLWLASFHPGAG